MTDSDSDTGVGERIASFLDELGFEELTPDYRDEHREAEDRLETAFDPLPDALAETPAVAEINKVNTHDDGGDVLVPVVPVLFEEPGEPDLDVVWETTGRVLQALHPVFETVHVRHYDVQFAYADADETEVVYRRITVHPPLAKRYLHDAGFDLSDLRGEVAAGDNGDDGVPPVNFKEFDAEAAAGSGAYAGGTAAVAAACAASSAGAAAGCAGAAAGAGAAGGGC